MFLLYSHHDLQNHPALKGLIRLFNLTKHNIWWSKLQMSHMNKIAVKPYSGAPRNGYLWYKVYLVSEMYGNKKLENQSSIFM